MNEVNKKLIPELRFPEFVNDGEWIEKKLGEVATFVNEKTSLGNLSVNTYISTENLLSDYAGVISASKLPTSGNFTKYNEGDILISNIRPYLKKVWFSDREGASSNDVFVVRANSEINEAFLSFLLKNDDFINYVMIGAKGVKMPRGDKDLISKYPISFPKEEIEQKEIASCLSSLDEVITAHSQKLEVLKDHKKGLMQNLFPEEGETVPKYRFPEFENDGEWEEKTVGQVYDLKVTNSFSREYLNYEKGKVKNIHYGDIHTKFNTLFDIEKENVPYINDEVSIQKIKKESYCIEGDIVFADASEDLNDVGKSIEIVNLNNEKLVSGLHTLLARQRKSKLAIGFGGYLFKSDWVRKQIQREAQGAKVLGISVTRISSVKILYPNKPQEQQKIASCLSALDALIAEQADKVKQLQLHKKGLMQGLFPKVIV